MLYKLILVDDENKIRNLLSKVVNWESLGFSIVGLFSDGDEAIEYIKQNEVHCVLSDIKMARVSGVEIARFIHENKLNIKIVLISAYQDFQYALDSIKYGVYNYLIKPAKLNDIKGTFSLLKKELDSMYQKRETDIDMQYRIEFLNNLISGMYAYYPDIENKLSEVCINVSISSKCAIWEFSMLNYKEFLDNQWFYHKSSLSNLFQNFFNDLNGNLEGYFVSSNDKCIKSIIFDNCNNRDDFESNVNHYINTFTVNISNFINIKTVLKSLTLYENISQLQNNNNLLSDNDVGSILGSENLLKCQLKLFNTFVISKNICGVIELLNIFLNELNIVHLEEKKLFVVTLISSTLNIFEDENLYFENTNEYIQTIKNTNSINELYDVTLSIYKIFINSLDLKGSSFEIVKTAQIFIKENCRNDISLEDVANHIHLSPNYLSKLFRKYSGETFLNFLIKTRMEKAKELLKQSGSKVYEVSESVGYKNVQFFYRTFRNNVGCTPKEYQTKYLKGEYK